MLDHEEQDEIVSRNISESSLLLLSSVGAPLFREDFYLMVKSPSDEFSYFSAVNFDVMISRLIALVLFICVSILS